MDEREQKMNGIQNGDMLDEDLLAAMDEFEELYGESVQNEATPTTATANPDSVQTMGAVVVTDSVVPLANEASATADDAVGYDNVNAEPTLEGVEAKTSSVVANEAVSGKESSVVVDEAVTVSTDETTNMTQSESQATDFGDGIGMGNEISSIKPLDISIDNEKPSVVGKIFAVLGVLAAVGLFVGAGLYIKHLAGPKKVEEDTQEVIAEITTEEPTTEAQPGSDRWFYEKEVCHAQMTDKTISLPVANMDVFEEAARQEEEQVPEADRIDPWASVTLNLESVEGSINLTNPGNTAETQQLVSTYMVLVDVDTGDIVAERNCEKQMVPASMTKILTVLTARDYIDESKMNDKFTITQDIMDEVAASGLSAVGFRTGDEVTVKDMLYGTIVCSGADAAIALARYCAGSDEAFVERMNENVELLGISDTAHFTNVVGKYDENLYCTTTDMAAILSVAMQDDLLRDVLSTRIYDTDTQYPKSVVLGETEDEGEETQSEEGETVEETTEEEEMMSLTISNWFLRRIEDKEMLGNVVGAKTGFVNQSGFCSASYYEADNGKRYICVTGNSFSSWRAIYDHVSVYRSFTN